MMADATTWPPAVIDAFWEYGYRAHVRDIALEHGVDLMWFTKADMLAAAEGATSKSEFVDAMERALAKKLRSALYWWPWIESAIEAAA